MLCYPTDLKFMRLDGKFIYVRFCEWKRYNYGELVVEYRAIEFSDEIDGPDDWDTLILEVLDTKQPELYNALLNKTPLSREQELELLLKDRAAYRVVKGWIESVT